MTTKTLHFRAGAELGIRLIEIAQEHLLYSNDIDKALNVFNASFGGGCPETMQLELLRGDKVIMVDEKKQEFMVVDRKPHHNSIFPAKIDFEKYFELKQKELKKHCFELDSGLNFIINELRFKDTRRIDFSVDAIINYIYGNDETIINEIHNDYELDRMCGLIKLTKEFIEKSMKLNEMSKRIQAMYTKLNIKFNIQDLLNLAQKMQNISKLEFIYFTEGQNDILTSYLDASKEIDKTLSDGIKPVDIMSNYTAGWLSPEGDYYALNGEIANFLHNQIADALMSKGIIPDGKVNSDSWLEQQGWVKIHEDNVQFAGCLNSKLNKKNVHMTDIQKKMIYEYISICHNSIVRAGWRLEKISATRFRDTDNLMLAKNYFSFD